MATNDYTGLAPLYKFDNFGVATKIEKAVKYDHDAFLTFEQLDDYITKKGIKLHKYQARNPRFLPTFYNRAHDGQRKLLDHEIAFLSAAIQTAGASDPVVVYIGSAPGIHIKLLVWLFSKVKKWYLYDAKHELETFEKAGHDHTETRAEMFARIINHANERKVKLPDEIIDHVDIHNQVVERISVRNKNFDDNEAKQVVSEIVGEKEAFDGAQVSLIFISDIRTGFDPEKETFEEIERKVENDMNSQRRYYAMMQADSALFKFRAPYTKEGDNIFTKANFTYLDGVLMLPAWGPENTTAMTLAVIRDWGNDTRENAPEDLTEEIDDLDGPFQRKYNYRRIEEVMQWYDKEYREHGKVEALLEQKIFRCFWSQLDNNDVVRKIIEEFEASRKKRAKENDIDEDHDLRSLGDIVTAALHDKAKLKYQYKNGKMRNKNTDNIPEVLPVTDKETSNEELAVGTVSNMVAERFRALCPYDQQRLLVGLYASPTYCSPFDLPSWGLMRLRLSD